MSSQYHREYQIRLPPPLAQLYSGAFNLKDARSRHDHAFYLFEALIKLTAAPLAAAYLAEVEQGARRVPALDRLLARLALPSLGQWVGILRELARYFGERADAASHPLGHLWGQLSASRRDATVALYRRIKNGPDGKPAGDAACSLLALFDALVQYRNGVLGHGGPRFESFFDQQMGPLLFPAANEVLAEGVLDLLGPRGTRLVYVTELRTLDESRVQMSLSELVGLKSERMAPLELSTAQAAGLVPNCVAVHWPGRAVPLRLDPLLVFRARDLSEDLLLLNCDRNGRQVEYLSYTTGETERDKSMAPALAKLLSRVTGHELTVDDLRKLSEQSLSDMPSVERLFEPPEPRARQVGEYEILGEIGRGGMGVVYLARQLSLGRLVALKMLPADLAGDEVALARFRREIRALARCDHPHIVKVLSSGAFPDGQLYYAMEYVPGADLEHVWRELAQSNRKDTASTLGSTTWSRAVLSASRKQRTQSGRHASETAERGKPPTDGPAPPQPKSSSAPIPQLPLPPLPELPAIAADDPGGYVRRVAVLICDAARALQEVHDQQIVHRDIKPENLMLTPDGSRVVLMDFGLAKGQSLSLSISRGAGFLGTLRYAAPEQLAVAQLQVGPSADIRGLGATLWELLTRQRLFGDASDEKQLASWVMHKNVPRLRQIDPTLDRDLEAIVAKATERNAEDRVQTARNLADYLDLYLQGKPVPIRVPGLGELLRRWVKTHKVAAATACGAAALFLAAFFVINQQRIDNANLASEKAKLAEKNREVADDNGRLLASEQLAKDKVEEQLNETEAARKKVVNQLATTYFQHGLAEEAAGRFDTMHRDLLRAWALMAPDESLRLAYEVVLVDRLTQGGRAIGLVLRHDEAIYAVAFSPDGTRVVTGSQDKTARLWDARSGAPLGEPMRHEGSIEAVAFSPDGTRVLTGSQDTTARLWDARSGAPLGEPMQHDRYVRAVAFSPDGICVVTGSEDATARLWGTRSGAALGVEMAPGNAIGAVAFSPDGARVVTLGGNMARLWDTRSGAPLGEPMRHDFRIRAMALSPDGTRIVTGSEDNTARLWDARTGAPLGEPMQHDSWVFAVAFSPDGARVATGSFEGAAQQWDARSGAPLGVSMRHNSWIDAVDFSPDGTRVVTGSGSSARLWDARSGAPLGEPMQHDRYVRAVAFSPDGTRVVTRSDGDSALLWDARGAAQLGESMRHGDKIRAVAFSPDGMRVLTSSNDKTSRLWDARTGASLGEPMRHDSLVFAVAFSPDGTRVLTVCEDWDARLWDARLWDARSGAPLGEPLRHDSWVSAVAFSPDGTRMATGSFEGAAQLWDARSGAPLGESMRHGDTIRAVAFSPDGTLVVTASSDKTARLWDAQSGAPLGESMRHGDKVFAVAFSPDGTRVVTASSDKTARLWDARTGASLGEPMRHDDYVNCVSFSPDGTRVVSCSQGGTARLWDGCNGEPLGEPMRHYNANSAEFSPDGTRVVTGSGDNTVRLWDGRTGTPLGSPLRHEQRIVEVAFSPDGTRIVTGSEDKTARLWDVEPVPVPHHNMRAWIEFQSGYSASESHSFGELSFDELQERLKLIDEDKDYFDRLRRWDETRTRRMHVAAAASAEEAKDWFAAVFHLTQLARLEPENGQHVHRLGAALAQQDRWSDALPAFASAVRLHPNEMLWQYDRALACLGVNDPGQYASSARSFLETAEKSDKHEGWDLAARLLSLRVPGDVEAGRLVTLARRAVEKEPENWSYRESLGASLFRAGEYAAALSELNNALSLDRKEQTKDAAAEQNQGTFSMHVFLALLYDSLGEHDAALRHRDKAFEIDDKHPTEDWAERLRRQILKQELTTVLGNPANSKANQRTEPEPERQPREAP